MSLSPDQDFLRDAAECLRRLQQSLDAFDPDELEADLAGGVLRIAIAGGGNCVINRQAAVSQIWMAEGATAWHFVQEQGRWIDTKGRGELVAILEGVLSSRLGRAVRL
jgi:iron donor protein CyaY